MKAVAAAASLAIVACCPCCFLIDLSDLNRGSDPPASEDAFSEAAGREVSTADAESADAERDAVGAADQSIGPDSSTDKDSSAATNDSSLGLAGDAADGVSDASKDRQAGADSDIADAPGADAAESGPAPVCSADLSNIGAADFRVAFSVSTQATKYSALLNQRSICNPGTFWDVRINGSVAGSIYAEIDDGTHLVNIAGSIPINDGNAHKVVFARTAGTLTVELDGVVAGMTPGTVGATASLGALPTLQQGTDVCDGQDGTQVLVGKITNVCLSH